MIDGSPTSSDPSNSRTALERDAVARGRRISALLGFAEDVVYALTGLLLLVGSLFALGSAAVTLVGPAIGRGSVAEATIGALDQLLLVLIFVELFYTIRLSIREHTLAVEPFLAVGLIATVRRILVLTAEERQLLDTDAETFRRVLVELGVLAGLIVVLVGALVILHRAASSRPLSEP